MRFAHDPRKQASRIEAVAGGAVHEHRTLDAASLPRDLVHHDGLPPTLGAHWRRRNLSPLPQPCEVTLHPSTSTPSSKVDGSNRTLLHHEVHGVHDQRLERRVRPIRDHGDQTVRPRRNVLEHQLVAGVTIVTVRPLAGVAAGRSWTCPRARSRPTSHRSQRRRITGRRRAGAS